MIQGVLGELALEEEAIQKEGSSYTPGKEDVEDENVAIESQI